MSIALPALGAPRTPKIDISWPILILSAALLCVLILLPMSWLIYYSLVDRTGAFTLDNFKTLFTVPVYKTITFRTLGSPRMSSGRRTSPWITMALSAPDSSSRL